MTGWPTHVVVPEAAAVVLIEPTIVASATRGATTATDVIESTLGAVARIRFTPLALFLWLYSSGGGANRESAPPLLCQTHEVSRWQRTRASTVWPGSISHVATYLNRTGILQGAQRTFENLVGMNIRPMLGLRQLEARGSVLAQQGTES
jgi:hypothetical protein